MTSRSRRSLLSAGFATIWLFGWITLGFNNAVMNVIAGAIGLASASSAIWLAWNSDNGEFQEPAPFPDGTFTSS
ncbi:MAG: hypothetical protein F2820_07190 [Actinobacteria bacterium]|nr:hypothetical protein [Actinomycetota bacterium]